MSGIYIESSADYCRINGVFTVCNFPGCHEVTTKHYIRGENPNFWEMYEKSHYAKLEPWLRDRVYILGFCDSHSSGGTADGV